MDLTHLLPHTGPMRLLSRVESVSGDRVVAIGRIPREAPGASEGTAPAILGLELGAQSTAMFAAAAAAERDPDAKPRVGYLVSLRSVAQRVDALPVEVDLAVVAERVGGAGGFEMFRVAVTLPGEGEPAVEGVVGTMLTDREIETVPDRRAGTAGG